MKLVYMPGACSLSTRIVLNEVGAEFASDKYDTTTGKTDSGVDFKSINPKGYVPFLQIDDENVLTENSAILTYLAEKHPDHQLIPEAGAFERIKFQELLVFISSELHKSFTPLFVYQDATPEQRAKFVARLSSRMSIIEDLLSDGREFLFADRFTIADAYAVVVLNWSNFVNIDLAPFPHIAAFIERGLARPAAQKSLQQEGLI